MQAVMVIRTREYNHDSNERTAKFQVTEGIKAHVLLLAEDDK
jgi:hypothetical protein